MQMIWKYKIPFERSGEFNIAMPKGASILTVAYQPCDKEFSIWTLVNPTLQDVKRCFRLIETGENVNAELTWRYIGILITDGGQYVLNLFETT